MYEKGMGVYFMPKCNECPRVIHQTYYFAIYRLSLKSFKGSGRVIIFLLLTLLVLSVSIKQCLLEFVTEVHSWHSRIESMSVYKAMRTPGITFGACSHDRCCLGGIGCL